MFSIFPLLPLMDLANLKSMWRESKAVKSRKLAHELRTQFRENPKTEVQQSQLRDKFRKITIIWPKIQQLSKKINSSLMSKKRNIKKAVKVRVCNNFNCLKFTLNNPIIHLCTDECNKNVKIWHCPRWNLFWNF